MTHRAHPIKILCIAILTLCGLSVTAQSLQAQTGAHLTAQQRAAFLRILPKNLIDFSQDLSVQACLLAGHEGDDKALLALASIDTGRRVIRAESDLLVNAYSSGASAAQLHALRAKRASSAKSAELRRAQSQIRTGQQYCLQVLKQMQEIQ